MESQPQNPEFMINPENFHPCFSAKRFCDRIVIYAMGLDARKSFFSVYKQQRQGPASAIAQSDQHLCYLLIGKYHI